MNFTTSLFHQLDTKITEFGAAHCTQALCGNDACVSCLFLNWKVFFVLMLLVTALTIFATMEIGGKRNG